MIHFYQSNRLEALVTVLANQLNQAVSDPFSQQDTVLVQSPGMSQWLKIQLAEQNGIAAHLDFPLPSSFIWSLYQRFLPDVPEQSAFNKDRMIWKLMAILPKRLEQQEFVHVNSFLSQDDASFETSLSNNKQVRLYQLAGKIADVFDNYLMYRPHWLTHWQQGHNDLPDNDTQLGSDIHQQQWQGILWRDLIDYTESLNQSPMHRANMHQQLLDIVNQLSQSQIKQYLPPRICVFGISTIPSHQLQLFEALSRHIEVNVYWLNPSAQFWGDILSDKTQAKINSKSTNQDSAQQYFVSGNPLLANWGQLGKDYLSLLQPFDIEYYDIFITNQQSTSNVLTKIQQDILELSYRNEPSPLSVEQLLSDFGKEDKHHLDDSVLIHNCHSRVRELEVLKDQLSHWFNNDTSLKAKDVLVMMPDVNQYAPFIDSVFKDDSEGSVYFPYSISDQSGLQEQPLLQSFIQILGLPDSRFLVSDTIDLLEVPEVMAKFGFDEAELTRVKHWLRQVGVHWGIDGAHKDQWQLPQYDLNTWLNGLQRMILGSALGEEKVWQGLLAYKDIEGLNTNTLAKLINYLSTLVQIKRQLSGELTIEQWVTVLTDLLEQVIQINDSAQSQQSVLTIQKQLTLFEQYFVSQDCQQPLTYKIVQQYFSSQFSQSGVGQRFLAGRINFCTLMPMRSVPFKIVCILGLNDGDYPRQVDPISFDLVALNPKQKGDRSRRLDDRYLFLEAMLSARDKLHLSYVGQSSKTNQEIMPSIILAELKEYLVNSYLVDPNRSAKEGGGDQFEIKHFLQPYNVNYFDQQKMLDNYRSYNKKWLSVSKGLFAVDRFEKRIDQQVGSNTEVEKSKIEEVDHQHQIVDQIDLSDFLRFCAHPLRYFYQQILSCNLQLSEDVLDDNEVFEHDPLQKYKIQQNLLTESLAETKGVETASLLSGQFPYGQWGKTSFSGYQRQVEQQLANISSLIGSDPKWQQQNIKGQVSFGITELGIAGQMVHFSPELQGQYLNIKLGSIKAKDKLNLWLIHLVRCSLGLGAISVVVANTSSIWFESLTQDQAQQHLEPWLKQYLDCQQQIPWVWHIDLAEAFVSNTLKGLSDVKVEASLLAKLEKSPMGFSLAEDPYVRRHFSKLADFDHSFYELSSQLITPMLDNLNAAANGKAIPLITELWHRHV